MSVSWQIQRYHAIASTNVAAAEWARERLIAGRELRPTAFVADRQHAGRGQHGRTWESPLGGLYVSAVTPNVLPEHRKLLPLIAGLAVCTAIEEVAPQFLRGTLTPMVRWPNDVLIAGGKVAGVLCESLVIGDRWAGVIGIGVNVTTDVAALPESLRAHATSLSAHGPSVTVADVERAVLSSLPRWLAASPHDVVAALQSRDALRGRMLSLDTGNGVLSGSGAGIAPDGALLVTTRCGIKHVTTATVVSVDGSLCRAQVP